MELKDIVEKALSSTKNEVDGLRKVKTNAFDEEIKGYALRRLGWWLRNFKIDFTRS